jgi:effector-binding domain-containing protein
MPSAFEPVCRADVLDADSMRRHRRGRFGALQLRYRVAMSPAISVVRLEPRPTAVITATTTWAEFPRLWGQLLGEVWVFLRANDHLLHGGGSSVMLYTDDTPTVEVGALVTGPFAPTGRIVPSQLPGGLAAHAVHRGPYSDLGITHDGVLAWCAANDQTTTRQRWEIYGDHHDDPSQLTTEVYWQLAD